jgi:hypothetical protein
VAKQEPRKIIKKFPFKMGKNVEINGEVGDELKDWKPTKIAEAKEQQKK